MPKSRRVVRGGNPVLPTAGKKENDRYANSVFAWTVDGEGERAMAANDLTRARVPVSVITE
ncbi:hypothetical protein ACM614_14425, partial [Streptomyces sp. 12297]